MQKENNEIAHNLVWNSKSQAKIKGIFQRESSVKKENKYI
jgi:hypothetical protein